ncbi:hypothetical protein FQN54_003656 [Arachnomyces sp. PD_36]|nr:hypothetical protein FQN54_003656 [Arachnomyces sp. PD_36]
MATLHSALQSLGPTPFDEVPSSDADLRGYIQDLLNKSRLIIESVPPPPPSTSTQEDSNPLPRATSASEITPSSARAPPPPQSLQHGALRKEWGKQVNKTNTSASKKDNPLDIPVYKLSGKDGKGAWFARRSVHEGLGFRKWKRRLEGEFEESLRVRREKEETQGEAGPGDGCVRGIGGEKMVERVAVPHADADIRNGTTESGSSGGSGVLGNMGVYQLSAQFPGPTAPRDFVTLLITSDTNFDGEGTADEDPKNIPSSPRSYTIISKPCDHPDTQPREGFIRGQYESVEFIREVPVDRIKNKTYFANKSESDILSHTKQEDEGAEGGRRRGKTVANAQSSHGEAHLESDGDIEGEDAELNPVEWIMVTRSDPGGTVPRWMVERGTPGSIVGDAVKFLDWACQDEKQDEKQDDDNARDMPETEGDRKTAEQEKSSTGLSTNGNFVETASGRKGINQKVSPVLAGSQENQTTSINDDDNDSAQPNGLMASVTGMVSSYAPQAVRGYLPGQSSLQEDDAVPASTKSETPNQDFDDGASISSIGTFESAASRAGSHAQGSRKRSVSNPTLPVSSARAASESQKDSSPASTGHASKVQVPESTNAAPTSQEKELAKLAARKREAEAKLVATRAEYETISVKPDTSSQGSKEAQDQTSASGRPESNRSTSSNKVEQQQRKRASTLNRTESKLIAQIDKLESQQLKINSKIEARQRKQAAREERAKGKQQIESLSQEVAKLREEVKGLKEERAGWVDLVGRLQRENTKLVAEAGGKDVDSNGGRPKRVASR